jgi:hypothetical protein
MDLLVTVLEDVLIIEITQMKVKIVEVAVKILRLFYYLNFREKF